ncbi:hypothetical protein, partial [Aeromonas sp. HMWF014]|uniref:hypothetical protein n=1 Tax=Aeromonas sp. HMWF014 TaxID=2056850 RepID=UPI001C639C85
VAPMVVWHSPCESRTLSGSYLEEASHSGGLFAFVRSRICLGSAPGILVKMLGYQGIARYSLAVTD